MKELAQRIILSSGAGEVASDGNFTTFLLMYRLFVADRFKLERGFNSVIIDRFGI